MGTNTCEIDSKAKNEYSAFLRKQTKCCIDRINKILPTISITDANIINQIKCIDNQIECIDNQIKNIKKTNIKIEELKELEKTKLLLLSEKKTLLEDELDKISQVSNKTISINIDSLNPNQLNYKTACLFLMLAIVVVVAAALVLVALYASQHMPGAITSIVNNLTPCYHDVIMSLAYAIGAVALIASVYKGVELYKQERIPLKSLFFCCAEKDNDNRPLACHNDL